MISKKISPIRCLSYSIAQVLGAISGAGMVRIMTPLLFDQVSGGANQINPNATTQEALGVEFGCTFLLVLTVMAATDSSRAPKNPHISTIAPLIIGLAVTAGHFIAIPVDNCSINPARSFGVSMVAGSWNDHWVFWFGPYLGSTGAALLYGYVLADLDTPTESTTSTSKDMSGVAPVTLRDEDVQGNNTFNPAYGQQAGANVNSPAAPVYTNKVTEAAVSYPPTASKAEGQEWR
jgi:Major intrinsic protein